MMIGTALRVPLRVSIGVLWLVGAALAGITTLLAAVWLATTTSVPFAVPWFQLGYSVAGVALFVWAAVRLVRWSAATFDGDDQQGRGGGLRTEARGSRGCDVTAQQHLFRNGRVLQLLEKRRHSRAVDGILCGQ